MGFSVGGLLVSLVLDLAAPFPFVRPDLWLRRTNGGSATPARRHQTDRLPLHIMQLYRAMLAEDRSRIPAAGEDEDTVDPALRDSDSVTSLNAINCQQIGKRWFVTFDLSSIHASEKIQLAELHIHLPAFTESPGASVDIYHSYKDQCSGTHCPENRLFLGRLRIHPRSMVSPSSWKAFNVTAMLLHWLQGEHATWRTEEEEGEVEDEQEKERVKHPTPNQVMMVVFSRQHSSSQRMPSLIHTAEQSKYITLDGERMAARTRFRRKRTSRQKTQQKTHRLIGASPSSSVTEEKNRRHLCRKVDMWVNFKKIGWSDWIVYPKQYNAYRCEGSCPVAIDETFDPTNHAFMQSVLQFHHPDKVPCASCAPSRLASLSMLYYENGSIIMRNLKNMIVDECSCH